MLIALDGNEGKGSGRSISAFDLHGGLSQCRDLLVRFGGHRAAAGVTIAADRVAEFAARFNAVAASHAHGGRSRSRAARRPRAPARSGRRRRSRRCCATWSRAASAIRRRSSWRAASPWPLRLARSARTVSRSCSTATAASSWRWGGEWLRAHRELDVGATIDVAYRLERDEWNGESRLQARLADFRRT